jgi:hypothetical protein
MITAGDIAGKSPRLTLKDGNEGSGIYMLELHAVGKFEACNNGLRRCTAVISERLRR